MNSSDPKVFDGRLVFKKGYTPNFIKQTIATQNLRGLRIFADLKEDRLDDIAFLAECSFLEELELISANDFSFGFLKHLPKLRYLSVQVEGENELDLSGLPALEQLSLQWRKNVRGLEKCQSLKELCLVDFKGSDLALVSQLTGLTRFVLKTGSIQTLHGMETLENLEVAVIANCKKLRSVQHINGLPKLRELDLDSCAKLGSLDYLDQLPSLQELRLVDCGSLDSLGFLKKLPSVSKLSLLGNTRIADGDLAPAERIEAVYYRHRKEYNVRLPDPPGYAELIKKNMAMIAAMRR